MRLERLAAAVAALALIGAAPAFDPQPWLEDWGQVEQAIQTKYANLEWAVFDRGLDLKRMFADTRRRVQAARNDGEARAAFDRFARKLNDGHVVFDWPSAGRTAPAGPPAPPDRCADLGYRSDILGPPLAALAPGYRPLADAPAVEFPLGLIDSGGKRVGVLKIGLFSGGGSPALCEMALKALSIAPTAPCDDACRDRVDAWTANRMTEDLASSLEALRNAGAEVLLVDVAGNGGGSQWAEAAARMLSPRRLVSERGGFVRGEHWIKRFTEDAAELREAAANETGRDRAMLLELVGKMDAMRAEAATPCDASPMLQGQRPACAWLGKGYYGTGVLGSADPARLKGKPWATTVFSPMEFPYREGVWRDPVIVLVDQDSASATAQFAAVLQDNRAAVIMGAPSDGGCGHTDGGTPTTLEHSKGVLEVPDCVRLRADGSNEVRGIQPDVLVGFTPKEGARLQAERFVVKLPEAVKLAASAAQ
jgi:hypothetical protein